MELEYARTLARETCTSRQNTHSSCESWAPLALYHVSPDEHSSSVAGTPSTIIAEGTSPSHLQVTHADIPWKIMLQYMIASVSVTRSWWPGPSGAMDCVC